MKIKIKIKNKKNVKINMASCESTILTLKKVKV